MSFWECDECGLWFCNCHEPPEPDERAQGDERLYFLCKEWLRSCSNAHPKRPWECGECTNGFKKALYAHLKEEVEP